jgi:glycosyltransferase involved in cell wall biosynthesis
MRVSISIVITAYNEGDEVLRTVESVRAAARGPYEIILVDDGSTDGSCTAMEGPDLRIARHSLRRGVAPSRNAGARLARGTTIAFLDAHQRLTSGCLERCAELALARQAIVWPDVCGIDNKMRLCHGAAFHFAPHLGFTARWKTRRPIGAASRISALKTPGYIMPRRLFDRVRLPDALTGWGASEAAVSLKAFFLGIPILHLCGPLARHLFKTTFQYRVRSQDVLRNHAILARICFDDRSWSEYWLPEIFAQDLPELYLNDLELPAIRAEQQEFQRLKVRSDRDFWRWLLKQPEPECLKRTDPRPRRSNAVAGASK